MVSGTKPSPWIPWMPWIQQGSTAGLVQVMELPRTSRRCWWETGGGAQRNVHGAGRGGQGCGEDVGCFIRFFSMYITYMTIMDVSMVDRNGGKPDWMV